MRLLHGAVLPLAQEYLEDADASSDFLRRVNKLIMQTGFVFRYCKGTKENGISKCTKSVLNNRKWAKYGKNGENRKYASC